MKKTVRLIFAMLLITGHGYAQQSKDSSAVDSIKIQSGKADVYILPKTIFDETISAQQDSIQIKRKTSHFRRNRCKKTYKKRP